ncbi:MAG: hypothetical protein QW356_07045 [Candidatus Hadarchaeales archaeon]
MAENLASRPLSRALVFPGDFLARRLDGGYASLIEGIREEIRAGRRMPLLCSLFVPVECAIVAGTLCPGRQAMGSIPWEGNRYL